MNPERGSVVGLILTLGMALAVAVAAVGGFVFCVLPGLEHVSTSEGADSPFILPGVRTPPAVRAADAEVADDARVIGVIIDGRPRAYLIKALTPMGRNVVNDLVGGKPVTITYCDRNDFARVLTGEGDSPLDVDTGGYSGGCKVIRFDGVTYYQNPEFVGDDALPGAQLPLTDLPFTRTTWGEWKTEHPETDIYVGT